MKVLESMFCVWMVAGAHAVYGSTPALISKKADVPKKSEGSKTSDSSNESSRPTLAAACPTPGPTVSLEYLYWKVNEELYAGLIIDYLVGPTDAVTIKTKLQRQKFEFTSGFRAGLGYNLPYEHYDVNLTWTWLQPHTTTRLFTKPLPPSGFQIAIALQLVDETGEDIGGSVGSLSSEWRMKFNMLDLQMGRKFFVGKRFSLRPNFGVKGGWINQTQVFAFNDVPLKDGGGTRLPDTQGSGKKTNKFEGIGPLIGADLRWGIGPQFGLFGNIGGALLYGRFDLHNRFFLANTSNEVPTTTILKNSHNRLASTVQMLIGGDWSRCLYKKWMVHLGAAYEVQLWPDQLGVNDSPRQLEVVTYRSGGDLMMHGLTVQAKFDF